MNRREYLDELARQLSALPEETRAAALSFYGEMLDDRMEDGMDERSAVAAMDDPAVIAARIQAESPVGQEAETAGDHPQKETGFRTESVDDAPKETGNAPWEDDAMQFSSLVDRVMQQVGKAMENVPDRVEATVQAAENAARKAEKTAEKAERFAESVAKKAEKAAEKAMQYAESAESGAEGGPEADEAPERVGEYERRVFTCPAGELQAVRLTGADMPIRIRAGKGTDATLVYYTSPKDPYSAWVEGGTLRLASEGKSSGRGAFSFSFFAGGFRMGWSKSSPTVWLTLPADALVDLNVETCNGSIRAQGLQALCRVQLTTSNSRIELRQIHCKSLEMKTSNGRLSLEDVHSRQGLQGVTSNGRIEGTRVVSGGEMALKTSNGRIVMENARSRDALRLTTSNGRIDVSGLEANDISLRTSNSSIRGVLPGRREDWTIESGTSNGRNSLPTRQEGRKPLRAYTSNGSIDLSFAE